MNISPWKGKIDNNVALSLYKGRGLLLLLFFVFNSPGRNSKLVPMVITKQNTFPSKSQGTLWKKSNLDYMRGIEGIYESKPSEHNAEFSLKLQLCLFEQDQYKI